MTAAQAGMDRGFRFKGFLNHRKWHRGPLGLRDCSKVGATGPAGAEEVLMPQGAGFNSI